MINHSASGVWCANRATGKRRFQDEKEAKHQQACSSAEGSQPRKATFEVISPHCSTCHDAAAMTTVPVSIESSCTHTGIQYKIHHGTSSTALEKLRFERDLKLFISAKSPDETLLYVTTSRNRQNDTFSICTCH